MLIHREIAVGMLDTDAIAVVDAPRGKDHGAVQGGVDDLVTVGGDVDTKMPIVGVEGIHNRAIEGHKEVLHQGTGLGWRQVVGTKEVVLVLGFVFSTQDTVLFRFLQRDSVGDAFREGFIDVKRSQGAVGSEVVTLYDPLQVLEIDVLLVHLLRERVGTEVEQIDLAIEVGVGIARYVFAQGRESDDDGSDDDEQQGHADDHQKEVEQVEPEIEHGTAALVVRHQEVISPVQFFQRDIAEFRLLRLCILRCF